MPLLGARGCCSCCSGNVLCIMYGRTRCSACTYAPSASGCNCLVQFVGETCSSRLRALRPTCPSLAVSSLSQGMERCR